MITPTEIVRRAEKKYRAVLRAWLKNDLTAIFPLEFPVGRLPADLARRRQGIEQLRQASKTETGAGYELIWETTKRRQLGHQTEPKRVIIAQLDDFLTLIRKRAEFNRFAADVQHIRHRLPALDLVLSSRPQWVIANHGQWDDLLTVCEYFIRTPRPNLYIRELPIAVHTKFIEQNQNILRHLLDSLLPAETLETETSEFCQRFGLKNSPAPLRLRLLDGQLAARYNLGLDDLSLPVEQAAHLLSSHVQPRHVIIVENLMTFLTLPPLEATVAMFGRGFAVHLLRDVPWLTQCNVIYWGDIDGHGFEILSDLRGLFPHTRSVLMNQQTLNDNRDYVKHEAPACTERFEHLTPIEAELARHVAANTLRLEQEHIPHAYAVPRVRQMISLSRSKFHIQTPRGSTSALIKETTP